MENDESQIEYLKKAVSFFEKVKWLYFMPVTKILLNGSLNLFPEEWLEILLKFDNDELNNFVTNPKAQSHWPKSLKYFIENCQKLNYLPHSNILVTLSTLPEAFKKKLSIKKQHEILHLTQLIHEKCLAHNIRLVVDFGAGLGYICQLLNYLHGYKVLGLESNLQNVQSARVRQKSFFPDSLSSVKYVHHCVTKDSSDDIKMFLQQEFNCSENFCLIGLHACGDLSNMTSKIYLEIKAAKLLILISCCYHKLTLIDDKNQDEFMGEEKYFKDFPMSSISKKTLDEFDAQKLFNRPFMRLACQETSDRWLQMDETTHEKHSFHVLARAILELYCSEHEIKLKKVCRKGTRKSQCESFENYLEDSSNRYVLEKLTNHGEEACVISWNDKIKDDMKILWLKYTDKLKAVELFTALQLLLQQAAESLILSDRMYFLKENNCEAYLASIMNRSLSPRSCALISKKCN